MAPKRITGHAVRDAATLAAKDALSTQNDARAMQDGLLNLASGLGTTKDKSSFEQFFFQALSPTQIATMYRADWIAGKAVDIPAEDATREWRTWKADAVQKTGKKAKQPGSDEDGSEARKAGAKPVGDRLPIPQPGETPQLEASASQIELLEAEERRLGLQAKVKRAILQARLWGGSALVIGTGGNAESELKPESVKKGGIKYLLVLNRWELTAGEIELDLASPEFGKPKFYELRSTKTSAKIHPSRIVRFIGRESPDVFAQSTDGWGDSILERTREAVRQAASTPALVNSLLNEAKVDIARIPNLSQHLSTVEGEAMLRRRFATADMLKSYLNTLILDANEEFDQKQINFSQFPELVWSYLQIAAAAHDIPATRFLSTSPRGMNATGDSDFRQYYDAVGSYQKNELSPLMASLDEMIIRSALGDRPPEIWCEWNPLWQMSELEKADLNQKKVGTLKTIRDLAVIPTDAFAKGAANAIVETGVMPGLEEALAESEMTPDEFAVGEEEAVKIEEQANNAAQREALLARAKGSGSPVGDAAPRTLYVRRDVLNGAEILKWARAQGFKKTLAAEDLRVTICYSKTPLDWLKVAPDWGMDDSGKLLVQPGGPRVVEPLGDEGAVVLLFRSWRLEGRHKEILEAGATSDYSEYQPHVTITYEPGDVDLSKVEPYQGKIVLGPEIFEEVNPSGFDPFLADAYNPDQPRDPAGTSTGGQWSSESGESEADLHKRLERMDRAAREKVVSEGKQTGREAGVLIDAKKGEVVKDAIDFSTANSVALSPEVMGRLADAEAAFVFHHNHPSSGSLSPADLQVLAQSPGLKVMHAHGHDGSSYSVIRGKSWDTGQGINSHAFRSISRGVKDQLQKLYNADKITAQDAGMVYNHLVNYQLRTIERIGYRYHLGADASAAFDRVSPHLKEWQRKAR